VAKIVHGYLDRIENLEAKVAEDSEKILEMIDIDKLIQNPEGVLQSVAILFLKDHLDEIKKGAKIGENFAKKILSKV
jgi:hypothetical protein